jgi:hypothetical protein
MATKARVTVWACMAGVGMLAGCGGGGSSAVPPTAQSDPAAYFNQVVGPGYTADRVALVGDANTGAVGLPNTAFDKMPAAGKATYTGYALVGVNRNGADPTGPKLDLQGTATLSADFAANAISGQATNFVGTSVGTQNPTTGEYPLTGPAQTYAGTINVTNGCIGVAAGCANVTRPNQFSAGFGGTLTGEGNTVDLSGSLLGDFKGSPIAGVAAQGTLASVKVNGTSEPWGFYIYAKK